MKFRKKPVVIEARQWHKMGDHEQVIPHPHSPDHYDHLCEKCEDFLSSHGWVDTLEGGHIVCPDDWIIKGVKGEFYPCKPDIFDATYEPAEDETTE
jgi:hypothetical protein